MSIDPSASTLIDASGEASLAQLAEARRGSSGVFEMHLAIARRLSKEGSKVQAFQELVRACREVPMSARLASSLVSFSLAAGTYGPALTLLTQGLDEAEGGERLAVMRHLARLARRTHELERSREVLVLILAERPEDRRARAVLNALLEREERWGELDASLEKETREALRRGALLRATRAALRRARLWDSRLDEHARAALRYMQAASYAEQAKEPRRAFFIRLLWLRSLHRSEAPPRALEDAVRVVLAAGEEVGQISHARSLIQELELPLPPKSAVWAGSVSRVAAQEMSVRAPERRRNTAQHELLKVAEAAEEAGQRVEAVAVLSAAVREGDDPLVLRRLESLHVQRGNWRELASFYREQLGRAAGPAQRAEWGEKLAELLESELGDPAGAAQAWGEVAEASGDARARSEQVRLLALRKDATGLRAALDAGVSRAASDAEKVQALVQRGEDALTRKDLAAAKADLEAALRLDPSAVSAAAGLAELASGAREGPAALRAFERSVSQVPRRTRGRGDLYRRLARLADAEGAAAAPLARRAWTEVLDELPQDEEGTARLLTLTRSSADAGAMEAQLKALLAHEPRGARSRASRLELVALLEAQGRGAEALAALKDAVKLEPGHREAWLAYAERLEVQAGTDLAQLEEVAWALEHAATATPEAGARAALWTRLERLTREKLRQPERAAALAQRVARMLERPEPTPAPREDAALGSAAAPVLPPVGAPLPGGPLVIPSRRPPMSRPKSPPPPGEEFEEIAAALEARLEPERVAPKRIPERVARHLERVTIEIPAVSVPAAPVAPAAAPAPRPQSSAPAPDEHEDDDDDDESDTQALSIDEAELAAVQDADVEEVHSGDLQLSESDVPVAEPPPPVVATSNLPALELELGDPSAPIAPSFGPTPARLLSVERETLFEKVRTSPLDPDGYRMLAEHFDTANDATRSSLMLELARALEGDPHAAPRTPRLILNEADRGGLRHPTLRGESGELLSLVGFALTALYPAKGRDAGSDEEFNLGAGRGAKVAAEALLAGVRILGLRAPDVFLSEDSGPPFSLVYAGTARILVGRLAIKKELSDAELRFFAGRALFTQLPDLMALRSLRRDDVLRALALVEGVASGRADSPEARVVRDMVPPRAWERVRPLLTSVLPRLDVARLADGARHSANRAGLVVCGGVAPALAALRAKRALPVEIIELVRFAASERYLQLRGRVLATRS